MKKIGMNMKPINCSVCGLVLFKLRDDLKTDESIVVRCKCGLTQKVSVLMVPQIKVEVIEG